MWHGSSSPVSIYENAWLLGERHQVHHGSLTKLVSFSNLFACWVFCALTFRKAVGVQNLNLETFLLYGLLPIASARSPKSFAAVFASSTASSFVDSRRYSHIHAHRLLGQLQLCFPFLSSKSWRGRLFSFRRASLTFVCRLAGPPGEPRTSMSALEDGMEKSRSAVLDKFVDQTRVGTIYATQIL